MKKLFTAFTACVTCIMVMNAGATPSTQIWIPSTDIQPYKKLHIGWDAYVGTAGGATGGTTSNGGLTIGVLPFSKVGLEIGFDYRDGSGNHLDPVYFNAKLGMPEGALFKNMPAIAIGGYDFGTRKDVTTYNLMYGLVAKNIWKLGRFSIGGFKGAIFSSHPEVLFGNGDAGILASWDRVMTEISDKLWLALDFQSGKSAYGALSFGAAWNFAQNVGVIVGYDIYNDHNLKPTVTVQFDVNVF